MLVVTVELLSSSLFPGRGFGSSSCLGLHHRGLPHHPHPPVEKSQYSLQQFGAARVGHAVAGLGSTCGTWAPLLVFAETSL